MKIDTIVVGAGIAGAAAAYFLSHRQSVVLLEREDHPGYHATGRTAAVYTENYNSEIVSRLVRAGRPFLSNPPRGFCEYPLLDRLGVLTWSGPDDQVQFERAWLEAQQRTTGVQRRNAAFALDKIPVLRSDRVLECMWEPDARSIDVNGLLQGYLRGFSKNSGRLVTGADVVSIKRGTEWHITTSSNMEIQASVLVNAAGAWAEDIAHMAGAIGVKIEPRRRTAILIDPPADTNAAGWPMASQVAGGLYFRPSGSQLLVSPADQTPSPACDASPDELDVAIAVERLEQETTLQVSRIRHRWAGLRSFAIDDLPVVGWDCRIPGFFWMAGQGGAGVKLSPALGMIAAATIAQEPLSASLRSQELDLSLISPSRFSHSDSSDHNGHE